MVLGVYNRGGGGLGLTGWGAPRKPHLQPDPSGFVVRPFRVLPTKIQMHKTVNQGGGGLLLLTWVYDGTKYKIQKYIYKTFDMKNN